MSTPVIILCGFMGTGKSAVGAALAALLDVPFRDTDRMIEETACAPVADIFAREGEARFRELEAEAVSRLGNDAGLRGGAVIATGGGILTRDDTHRALAALGRLVVLDAPLDVIAGRAGATHARPLLPRTAAGDVDMDALGALFEARLPRYEQVSMHVDTSGRSPVEVAFEIAERVRHAGDMVHVRVDTRPLLGHTPRPGESRLSRVVIGRGTLPSLGRWMHEIGMPGPAFVFSSRRVAGHYGVAVRDALDAAGIRHRFIEVDDAEQSKTLEQAERLLYELTDSGATRDAVAISLGGGVTGDLAGFVAATYMRGLAFVQVPTTLVAQMDASIGGKVGVNHPRVKNLVGTIHQPHLVLTDPDTLATLPARELAGGMAEVVKTALVGSPPLFEQLRLAAASGAPQNDPALLDACVRECVRIKARVVEADPYERDRRRVLNLGHTLGHAVEAAGAYDTVTHGEAVAIGLMAAVSLSVNRGIATADLEEATRTILVACGLPTALPSLDGDALRRAIAGDKKRRASGLRVVLPVAPGDVRIVDDVTEDELVAVATA